MGIKKILRFPQDDKNEEIIRSQYKNANQLLRTKKYRFWLVASDMNEPEDTRVFDNLKDLLFKDLRDVLTGKVMDRVEIIPSDRLASKLAKHAATS